MTADRPRLPLRDYFAGIAEFAFETRLGIADPPLVDYIAGLLTRFIHAGIFVSSNDLGRRSMAWLAGVLVLLAMWVYSR